MPRPIIIIDEQNISLTKTKSYLISAFGHKIKIAKWWKDDSEDPQHNDIDYQIQDEKFVKKTLTELQWDQLLEFINNLT